MKENGKKTVNNRKPQRPRDKREPQRKTKITQTMKENEKKNSEQKTTKTKRPTENARHPQKPTENETGTLPEGFLSPPVPWHEL